MIDLEILRRKAKRGISFPKQSPQWVDLFGNRCLVIGFYRGEEKRILFIADESNEEYFHDCTNIFKIPYFKYRCLLVDESDITITPVGGFHI